MSKIDIEDVAGKMLDAAKGVLRDKWPQVGNYAKSESLKFAQSMADIQMWKVAGQITEPEAKALSRLHQRSMKMVLTSLEVIGLAMAEKTINAELRVVRGIVNTAIGWKVI